MLRPDRIVLDEDPQAAGFGRVEIWKYDSLGVRLIRGIEYDDEDEFVREVWYVADESFCWDLIGDGTRADAEEYLEELAEEKAREERLSHEH